MNKFTTQYVTDNTFFIMKKGKENPHGNLPLTPNQCIMLQEDELDELIGVLQIYANERRNFRIQSED
jgi:hypothetical protein